MTSYQVSLEQMEFVGGEMDSITKQIQLTLADLGDGIKQNLSQWESSAADVYHQAQQTWTLAANDMQAQLATATTAVGTINEYYTSGERYGVSLWDQ